MAKQPAKNSAKNTFARPLSYPTRPVPLKDAFRRNSPVPRNDYISLGDLAKELSVKDVDRLRPVLEHRYLKLIEAKEYLKDCIVARPLPAAMDWLRTLMAPAMMQPIFTMEMVCDLLHCSARTVRRLCILHNIPLHQDPAFGELMTLRGFHTLYRGLYSWAGPARYDRQALLFLMNIGLLHKPTKVLPYSRRVEAEIQRIAKMREPDRTFRAMTLLEAYQDASTIGDCIVRYGAAVKENVDRVEDALKELRRRLIGQPHEPIQPDASSSDQDGLDAPFPSTD